MQMSVRKDMIAISDMTIEEWRQMIKENPDARWFDMFSSSVENGDIISIKDNLHVKNIRYIMRESIKKVIKGDI